MYLIEFFWQYIKEAAQMKNRRAFPTGEMGKWLGVIL
jgi:hypothetical protein